MNRRPNSEILEPLIYSAAGWRNREIALKLLTTESSVKHYLQRACTYYGVDNTKAAIAWAAVEGAITKEHLLAAAKDLVNYRIPMPKDTHG